MGVYEDAYDIANNEYGSGLEDVTTQQRDDWAVEQGKRDYDALTGQGSKVERLSAEAEDKRERLRKDTMDYGDDGFLVEGAKNLWNMFADREDRMAINKDGKRYFDTNKIFNDDDMSNVWNEIKEDPAGDKVLYYMKKHDGIDADGKDKWLYKPGIASVSAYDRYSGQLDDDEWQLIGEKRFSGAEVTENKIHGNSDFLKSRAFDLGRSDEDQDFAEQKGLAWNDFGAGKSELYTKDILGADRGTKEEYEVAKARSRAMYEEAMNAPWMREDNFESLDALGAATQTLAGNGIKAIGEWVNTAEGDGALETLGKRWMEDANKDWDYNDRALKQGAARMKRGFDQVSNGNVSGVFDLIAGTLQAAPQAVAGSIPEMSAYVGGGAVSIGIRAGMLALANANDELDAREIANGGRKATAGEIAAVHGAETIASLLDLGAFRFVTKGLGGLSLVPKGSKTGPKFDDVIKQMDHAGKIELAKALGKSVGRGTGAFATEAVQETTTEAIRMLAETLGTDKYGDDAGEILTSGEGQGRLTTAAVLGGAGGVGFGAPRNLYKTTQDVGSAIGTARKVNKGVDAQSADSEQDAVMKSMIADEDLDNARDTYDKLGATSDKLNELVVDEEANDLDAIMDIVEDPNSGLTSQNQGLIRQQLEKIANSRNDGKNIETEVLTQQLAQTVADIQKEVGRSAQATAVAKKGLDEGVESGRYGKAVSEEDEVLSDRKDQLDNIERELGSIDQAKKDAEAAKQLASEQAILFDQLKKLQSEVDAERETAEMIDDEDFEFTDEFNKKLTQIEALQQATENMDEEIVRADASVNIKEKIKEIDDTALALRQEKIDILKKIKRAGEDRAGASKIERDKADIVKEQSEIEKEIAIEENQGEIDVRIKGLEKVEEQERKENISINKSESIVSRKKQELKELKTEKKDLDVKSNRLDKDIDIAADTLSEEKNRELRKDKKSLNRSIKNKNKKIKDKAKKLAKSEYNLKEKKKNLQNLRDQNAFIRSTIQNQRGKIDKKKIRQLMKRFDANLAKLQKADEEINRIEEVVTEEIAMQYDPVGKQVESTKQTARDMSKKMKINKPKPQTTEEKMSVASKVVGYVFDKVTGKIKDIKKTRGAFSEKLSQISNAALRKLSTEESINELEEMFKDKRGYKPFSRKQIVNAINSEVKKRGKSDEFFGKRKKNISATDIKTGQINKQRREIKDYFNKIMEKFNGEGLTEEESAEANKNIKEKMMAMQNTIAHMSPQDLRRWAGDMHSELFQGYKDTFATINPDMVDIFEGVENQLKKAITPESKKKFVLDTARANMIEDDRDIEMALDDLDFLLKDGVVTEQQYESLKTMITAVGIRAKEDRMLFAQQVREDELRNLSEIDKDIMDSEVLSKSSKEKFMNYPDRMKVQLANTFDILSNEDMLKLQRMNITVDIKDGVETVSVEIC